MTGRESGERSAEPECSLILFSIHCVQRLEAPEGSPAPSLDAESRRAVAHLISRSDRTSGAAVAVRAESVRPPKGRRHPGECARVGGWVHWWVGHTVGSAGDAGCPAAPRGLQPVIYYSVQLRSRRPLNRVSSAWIKKEPAVEHGRDTDTNTH